MELKLGTKMDRDSPTISSNCTFMELKLRVSPLTMRYTSSNCTFMELKFLRIDTNKAHGASSNCTFMELKFPSK